MPDGLLYRAAAEGRWDVVGAAGAQRLSAQLGNRSFTALVQRSRDEPEADGDDFDHVDVQRLGEVGEDGVRRFGSDREGAAYGERVLGGTYKRLPPEVQHAAKEYTRNSWPYNEIPRLPTREAQQAKLDGWLAQPGFRRALVASFGNVPTLDDIWARIKTMDRAFTDPLPETIEVKRSLRSIDFLDGYDGDPRDLEGTVQREQGFISTSVGDNLPGGGFRKDPYHLTIAVPGETAALWMGGNSAFKRQRELILPRGTVYEITDVARMRNGTWDIRARVLPPGGIRGAREGGGDG